MSAISGIALPSNPFRSLTEFKSLVRVFLLGAGSHFFLLVSTLVTLQVYDRVLTSRRTGTLVMLCIAAVIALLAWGIIESGRNRWMSARAAQLEHDLVGHLSRQVIRLHLNRAGHVASQLWQDVQVLRSFVAGPAAQGLMDLPWSLVYLLVIFSFHPLLGGIALAGIALICVLAWATDSLLRGPVARFEVANVTLHQRRSELASFAQVLHAHGQDDQVAQALTRADAASLSERLALDKPGQNLKTLGKLTRQLLQLAMLSAGAWLVIQQSATGGVMIAGSILLGKALTPVEMLIGSWKSLIEAAAAYRRLRGSLLHQQLSESRLPGLRLPKPSTGRLNVRRLTVVARGDGDDPRTLLSQVSFDVLPGETVAVLGPSGSGKSTLAASLVGVHSNAAGEVLLDGANISQYLPADRGMATGYLPQDVQLHGGSVAQNIARKWFSDSTHQKLNDEESGLVVAAARLAGAHELILSLPQGYDTFLASAGSSGHVLSGGQRQRIALARALYGSPSLLVLDEPDSQLDTDGANALKDCLHALHADGKTVVLVTHRSPLVDRSDKVLLLRDGKVEQFGPRERVREWIAQRSTPTGRLVQAVRPNAA